MIRNPVIQVLNNRYTIRTQGQRDRAKVFLKAVANMNKQLDLILKDDSKRRDAK